MSAVENDFWAKIANLKELKVSCALGMQFFQLKNIFILSTLRALSWLDPIAQKLELISAEEFEKRKQQLVDSMT